jgi:hypothetical protein
MIAIWKFDESGHLDGDFPLVWYDTIPSKAYPVAIVVESTLPQAPIYVVGAYAHAGEGLNVVILKIDYLTIGGHAHITPPQTYNNSAQNGDDYPVAMTDVVNGNLWVAVASTGVGTGMDYLVLGVDPAGLSIFASARYNNSPSNKSDIPADIKATSVGFGTPSNTSVVITGTSFDNVTKNDIVTIEYTYLVGSCGLVQRPELRYSGLPGATTNEVATSLAITGSGVNYAGDCGAPMSKIFVCGYTNGTPSGTNDYLVIGYPRTGSVIDLCSDISTVIHRGSPA